MRLRTFLPALCLLALAVPAAAQSLLPPAFEGWRAGQTVTVKPEGLAQLAGEHAAILREYGIASAERRSYARAGGKGAATSLVSVQDAEQLTVTLYRMRDPTAAYGAFTYLRAPEMVAGQWGARSAVSDDRALILAGNLVLEVAATSVKSLANELKTLSAAITSGAASGPYPTLENYLPAAGFVRNSDRFVLGPAALGRLLPLAAGDWAGFASGAEALLARYRLRGAESTLLLISYPTPQVAALKLEEMAARFNLNAEDAASSRPVVFGRRSSSLVALVAETPSAGAARALLDEIAVETVITWNEPGHKATDPPLSVIIVGTIFGTGVLLMYTLVAGLAMGGLRLLIKRWLPGTVFDREKDIEIIQLGLSSKPIDAKDFYQVTARAGRA
jgi:hypothetical protein